jgi:NitT/TauT family transport system substrate-binding protein
MTNNGNRPEQLSRQVVGLTPAIFQLVKQGKLDGYVVSLDTAVALDQQDPEAVVFDPGTTMNAGTSNYITSETQARDPKKADQIRRYLASIDEAMRFVIADRADGYRRTIDCISKGFRVATFATPEVARAALDGYVDAWTVDGEDKMLVTQPADWRAAYDEAAKAGLVRSGQDPTTWLSSDFEPRAGS